jgi:hypothetical protein
METDLKPKSRIKEEAADLDKERVCEYIEFREKVLLLRKGKIKQRMSNEEMEAEPRVNEYLQKSTGSESKKGCMA